jgi:XTP/dITP diphosphohydrolase
MARTDRSILVLATRNRKKGLELAELIDPPWEANDRIRRLDIRVLDDFETTLDVVEDADSFAGNARKKASEMAREVGHWVLADDSGLTVDALGGAPGIFSARYAGGHGEDFANNAKLLDALSGTPGERRGAAFVCALALADPTGAIRLEASGSCRGRITDEARGSSGFGYDPLFLIREYHKTFGELSPLVKHQLSHRSRAFAQFRSGLERLIAEGALELNPSG